MFSIRKLSRSAAFIPAIAALLLAGCGQGVASPPPAADKSAIATDTSKPSQPQLQPKPDPVTVTFYLNGTEAAFFKEYGDKMIHSKWPNITLKIVEPQGDFLQPLTNAIAAKEPLPDVIGASPGALNVLVEQGLLSDLTPLIKAQNFDLGRLIPELVEGVKTFSDKGEFLFMPYNVETTLLMYNKSLFDKFGVAYPKNGMTWQDAVELTRKMSREDGGTVYRGLDVLNATWFQTNPYSMPYYNAKTGNSTLDDPTWAKVMAPLKQFNDIPNNQIDSKVLNKARDYFMKDRTLAMFPISFNFMQSSIADGSANGLSWDLAALPYFTDLPKISAQLSYHYFIIPPTSKVKEDAFRAIAAILTDDNVRAAARAGKEPVLKDNKIQADFAKDLSYMKDKNISAFFFDHFSLPAPSSPYDTKIRAQLSKAYTDIALNGVDMNTALRSAKEAADKLIEASKQ